MQDSLFGDPEPIRPAPAKPGRAGTGAKVLPAVVDPALRQLAAGLPKSLRLGTSSWHFPGWNGLVWNGEYPEATLSKHGLPAYAQHPLLRTVSVDRGFYRPMTVAQHAAYAAQVPDDFRFVVKAPSLVTDAMIRNEDGRGLMVNHSFLDPERAFREFVEPALLGLGPKIGALVFQLSPLPTAWLTRMPQLLDQLDRMLAALPPLSPVAPDGVYAIEFRDPEFLQASVADDFIRVLKRHRATVCLGLHAKLPPIAGQLPLLRALWPGPLVCRWNLNAVHGAFGYADAKQQYAPFDRIIDPDPDTRNTLARVIAGTTKGGQNAFITLNNKAEGSAPRSILALAEAVRALWSDAPA